MMSELPCCSDPAAFYFKELDEPNHLLLHEYYVKTLRSKGFEIDDNRPAYESPFYEESIKLRNKRGIWVIHDSELGKYVSELKKEIEKIEPNDKGVEKFKSFMKEFFISLPEEMSYELQPIDGEFKSVNW